MLNSSSLDSYSAGARAVRAKSLGSLALGAAALAGLATEAEAAISAFTVTSNNVASAPSNLLCFDVVTGETSNTLFLGNGGGVVFNISYSGDERAAQMFNNSPDDNIQFAYTGPSDVQKLSFGDAIKGLTFASQPYLNSYYSEETATSVWSGNTGYVGFKRTVSNTYGWLKFSVNADASAVTLLAMGYNDEVGGAITAGEGLTSSIPEPATSAVLLGLGAAGLAAYRRRKQIQRAAA